MNTNFLRRHFLPGLLLASCLGLTGCQSLGKHMSCPFGFGGDSGGQCSGGSCGAPLAQTSGDVEGEIDPATIFGGQPAVKQVSTEQAAKPPKTAKGPDSLFSDFR